MPASYTVAVGSFEGPFDLLLQLIARHQVDVHEISLAEITDDYLAVLAEMEQIDLEVTTEFLVVAATLLEIKAARLLPGEDDPELDEQAVEVRDLLYARLIDYRTFKHAAGWLQQRLSGHAGLVPRETGPDPAHAGLRPPVRVDVAPGDLARLAARALAAAEPREVDTSHLQPVRLTVREAAGMVLDELLRAGGKATFTELTAGCRHRVEVIVHFLALLELAARDHVELAQAERFGTLTVALATAADGGLAIDDLTATSVGDAEATRAAAGEDGEARMVRTASPEGGQA